MPKDNIVSRAALTNILPQIVVSPALLLSIIFFYALAIWVAFISFTESGALPTYNFVGLRQYEMLWADDFWWLALKNLAKFAPLYVGVPLVLGCCLAILLDQKIRFGGIFRILYLYPAALSFAVAGTVWRWLLTPDSGIDLWLRQAKLHNAPFDWLVSSDKVVLALAIVAIWQSTGFVMALFITGLRSVDDALFKCALLDGASLPRIYWHIVLPALRPTIFSATLLLLPAAAKTFDLVFILTQGGPGRSSVLPAYYMFDMFFRRNQMGQGAAAGMILLMMCAVIALPYIHFVLKKYKPTSSTF